MWRSIAAVAVGFVLIGALSVGTDAAVHAAMPHLYDASGRTESVPLLLVTLLYVGVYAVAGCYLTARLAPGRPMRHAMILGALGLALNLVGSIAVWDTVPVWYHVVALALVLPFAWMGGRLRERELERRSAAPALAT